MTRDKSALLTCIVDKCRYHFDRSFKPVLWVVWLFMHCEHVSEDRQVLLRDRAIGLFVWFDLSVGLLHATPFDFDFMKYYVVT